MTYTDVPQMTGSAASLFPNYSSATDSAYLLNATSAYNTNGNNGYKRGAFEGPATSRYVQSCLAPIPVIYEASTTGAATQLQGLPVIIKARTIK